MTCGGDPNVIGIVVAGLTGVHTNNGTVTGCGTGILLSGGGSHHLNGLTATGNVCCGGGGTGDGIRLEASHDNHINGSSASLNHAVGVRMVGSDRNRLNMMVINSNEGPPTCGGVLLVDSDNNVVSSSDISDNGDFGVEAFSGSDNNRIQSSTVNGTNFFGSPTPRIVVFGGTGTVVRGNSANGNSFGIALFGATMSTVQSNTATGNTFFDLFEAIPGCDANTWKDNTFGTSNDPCIN